ncbi:MAG: glycine cleavage T C-terminal barrel domain-containing protein [Myxococcota bacterium]|jgi:folate-binding protein YgfZ
MNVTEAVRAAVQAARVSAVLFEGTARGVIEVSGSDRVRWLDGMISGDVGKLEAADDGAGCYATLLTNRGAIVADLHVGRLGERFWLESTRSEIPRISMALDRFIIADDVNLVDLSEEFAVWGLEGPLAGQILSAAIGGGTNLPAADCWGEVNIAGADVVVGAFGWSGESAYQLWVAPGAKDVIAEALDAAAGSPLIKGDETALEVLRVEAGIPALGSELDEEVLPPEARLERAIATDKGCYVGQEIVARLRARGQVNHLLVGLKFEPDTKASVGVALSSGGKSTGEVTTLVESPDLGRIALGYVRRDHAEPGTVVDFEGGHGTVAALPFVVSTAESTGS